MTHPECLGPATELLIVRARNQVYCMDLAAVREIAPARNLRLNQASDRPYGWLSGHDSTIPVHVLAWLLQGVCTSDPVKGRVLQIDQGEQIFGVIVDSFDYPDPSTSVSFFPLPDAARGARVHYTRGVANVGGELMLYLAADRLESSPDSPPNESRLLDRSPSSVGVPAREGDQVVRIAQIPASGSRPGVAVTVGANQVCGTIDDPRILSLHETPPHVGGLVAWNGAPIPVIHTDRWLGSSQDPVEPIERLVVTRAGEGEELLALASNCDPESAVLGATAAASGSWLKEVEPLVKGVFGGEDNLMLVPELESMLDPYKTVEAPVTVQG